MSDLTGVVVGGILAIAGGIAAKCWEEFRQRQALRAALRAEIAAHLEITKRRDNAAKFEEFSRLLRSGEWAGEVIIVPGATDVSPRFPTYERNVDKIGLLGPDVAADLTRFMKILDGVSADLRAYARGEFNEVAHDRLADLIEQDLAWSREAREIGGRLIKRL